MLVLTLLSLLFLPILGAFLIAVILAAIGKSLGVRKKYIEILLKVFEFGRGRIETYERQQQQYYDDEEKDSEHKENDKIQEIGENNPEPENAEENSEQSVIEREISISALQGIKLSRQYSLDLKRDFELFDIMYFAKCGAEAIIQDDVTHRFSAAELPSWNLLSRTNKGYQYISARLTILWCMGCFVRYFILLPFRLLLCTFGIGCLIVSTAIIGYLPKNSFKKKLNHYASLTCHRILARACSAYVTYHNRENKATNGICVANHTSPIDIILLSTDNSYAMVGQLQGGLIGILQRAMSRATAHIWFERSEVKDRMVVVRRLQEHVEDKNKLPILIFPEGTCINNTSVMMFKKGSFEIGSTIYPVAIKYDSRFGDAFWNSSKMGMVGHLLDIFTSWALVVEVWYLPPMTRQEGENAVNFANRVKSEIASKGGLVDLEWDGQLKRMKVKESWKSKPQEHYSNILKVE